MANENPSGEGASRQQSSERAQSGSATQQGAGAGGQRGGTQGSHYGQGAAGQAGAGQEYGTSLDQGRTGQGSQAQATGQGSYGQGQGRGGQGAYGAQGTSTWQGGRAGQGGALQRRGSSAMSPYASPSESGYGSGPFSLMRRISDEMDRFFGNFGMGRGFFPSQERDSWNEGQYGGQNVPSMWSPHIEVCERNGKLLIQADLPGMKRDDINVRIEQDAVVIQGERNQQQTSNQGGYYRSERSYGSFYRTIPLPEGTNTESATASFRDGVLEIELDAPREQQRGRTLEIRDVGPASGSYGSSGSMQGGRAGTGSGSTYGSGQYSAAGSQQASGTGTMYSGSGNPSAGAPGMGTSSGSDRSSDKSRGSGES